MTNNNLRHCTKCLIKAEIFNYLTHEELVMINATRFEVSFNPGELMFKQGSPSTHVISFVKGLAKITLEGNKESKLLLKFVTPPEFVSGAGLYNDQRHHFSVPYRQGFDLHQYH